jgi:hypothetical protein
MSANKRPMWHIAPSPSCIYWPYWHKIGPVANGGNGSHVHFCGGGFDEIFGVSRVFTSAHISGAT